MRGFKTKDIFAMSRILKKMGLKPNIQDGITQEQLGAELLLQFVENLGEAEEEVSAFFADLMGITAEEFLDLDIEQTAEAIKEFKEQKGIQDFFTQAVKLTK